MFCFSRKKAYNDFILLIKNGQINSISDGQINSIVWKLCGTYLTSTVIPQYVTHLHWKRMIQMNSIVWNLCI